MRFRHLFLLFALAWTASAQDRPFGSGLYQVMQNAGCPLCHNPNGVASATRIHFPEADASPEKIEAFGRSLVVVVDRNNPEASLLLNKPTARIPHTGGERIKPGSPEEAVLKAWVNRLARLSGPDLAAALKYREMENAGSGESRPRVDLRRLTHSQYNHTVRDLLGDTTQPSNQFPPEDFVNGFRNQGQAETISPLLMENYSTAAERLAKSAFRGGDASLIPCKPSAACRTRFVKDFGLKAFRRPLEPTEQKRYETLMMREKDFTAGAQLVIEAMLQSPDFLFRFEETSYPAWKPYAAASRLSYALWDSMPDAELFAAAARGDLNTRQGVDRQARRLLDDPRAHEALNEFVSQWLRFDRVLTASKDRRKYPDFTLETAESMTEEARVFVGDLVWNDRNFMDLFSAGYTFANADLAAIYGIKPPAKEFGKVSFPADSERAGVLGQTLFLALTAKPEDSSPTARGLFVREQFLCQHVPPPPPGVNTNLPPVTEAKPQTNRDRMTEHASNPMCASCHKLMDPIGFGLEKFDSVGARRDKYTLTFATGRGGGNGNGNNRPATKKIDLDLNTAGTVAGLPDSSFSSPAQLGAILAKSAQCQECVVKQYFRYTTGRMEVPADRPVITQALDDFRKSQYHFKDLMLSLVRLREFPGSGEIADVGNHH